MKKILYIVSLVLTLSLPISAENMKSANDAYAAGNYEEAIVTSVGKAATQTNLAIAANAGDISIKVTANSDMTVGDILTIGTGSRKENVKIRK